MFDLSKLVRPNILRLKPYSSARDEFSGRADIYLDANENSLGSVLPRGNHSRYPDPKHSLLRNAIAARMQLGAEKIFIGNGSDEAIDLVIRIFCRPGVDSILTVQPSYGMYQVYAEANDVGVRTVKLKEDFSLDQDGLLSALEASPRVLFLCNPNNPTGNGFSPEIVKGIVGACLNKNLITVIDEAYVDFCPEYSMLGELSDFPNLIVLQTFSKAWGLAEARLGLALSSSEIINLMYKIKPPYNVSGVNQQIAVEALRHSARKKEMVKAIVAEREELTKSLLKLKLVLKVYPSDTNFLLVKFADPRAAFQQLLDRGIVVRDRSNVLMCEGCLRITVGTKDENKALLSALSGEAAPVNKCRSASNVPLYGSYEARKARIERKTNETHIIVELNLDGTGLAEVSTGIGFFDHMLLQIAKHGGIDLKISCEGDLDIDEHHTIEDTAITLGKAFKEALGSKRGFERYGFTLPMDDALAQVALDFGGRSFLVWEAAFTREKIGEMPTEMFSHFFKSFCDGAESNLNIKAEGANEHHKIESIFKCFARAIKQAVSRDLCADTVPSTKGTL